MNEWLGGWPSGWLVGWLGGCGFIRVRPPDNWDVVRLRDYGLKAQKDVGQHDTGASEHKRRIDLKM
ncbi:hypothetical protein BDP27DRAFT_1334821 [Rhodocollybia butyracea]|uniref:Uncharacterized protein n=1 Tax=Rhodocollybia butyracea TaxID=206335 RepID=A0A9P5U2L5_9AGAR|nr:hypothetical protein BDP27DRAFT_1334821 [Rhodocollybia butyracea]